MPILGRLESFITAWLWSDEVIFIVALSVAARVIYSGSSKKIAEHGGGTTNDTGVALLVSLPGIGSAQTVSSPVGTTQVAPTILRALGIDPNLLEAVSKESTPALPSLF